MRNRLNTILSLLIILSTSLILMPVVLFTPSQVVAQTKTDRHTEADRLFQQGNEQFQTSQFEAALQSWQQALIIYQEINDRKAVGIVLGNIGLIYDSIQDYPKAIDYFNQGLTIARQIKYYRGEGIILGNLGDVYLTMQDYPKAIYYFNQSLKIARQIKDRKGEGLALNNIGATYSRMGDYTSSINYSNQSLTIAREINDLQVVGNALGDIGDAYLFMGDYSKAIDYSNQSLTIAREINDRRGESTALTSIGNAYLSIGDYITAIDYFNQSLNLAQDTNDPSNARVALNNIGSAYIGMGNNTSAIDYLNQSLKLAQEINDRKGISNAFGSIGIIYINMGNYPSAINYLNQSLNIAREINDSRSIGKTLSNIGVVYMNMGNYPLSINYFNQSLKLTREINDREGEGTNLNNLGYSFYKSGNFPNAEKHLLLGLKVYESLRDKKLDDAKKVSLLEVQRDAYNTLQQVYIAQNKTDAALEVAERGRARAFVDLIASRLSINTNLSQIYSQPLTISQIQQIAKTHSSSLVQYSIIYDDFKVAGKLQVKESQLYIWVIKPSGNITFRKVDIKPLWQKENTNLDELVATVRNNIGARGIPYRGLQITYNPDNTKTKINLRRLYELLIDPIADLLPKNENEKVVFIPQSSLFLVPFPALQDADGKYLIQKHTILTSPSIQVLDLTHKQREAIGTQPLQGKDTLIVGNPTMPSVSPKIGATPEQLPSLPGAEKEAKAIGNLLNTKPLIGNEATKATVLERLKTARFVHLATHGIFDDLQGINSSIALAPNPNKSDKNDNGLLTAGEILDLKLNAELVVLSACDTGRGKITGDGVIGLSRALISAGVPSVLVSLWSVPDAPTSLLMTEFYKNLQKNPDKAQALRQAMLTTMKSSPNPVDWAAFTLIGEAN